MRSPKRAACALAAGALWIAMPAWGGTTPTSAMELEFKLKMLVEQSDGGDTQVVKQKVDQDDLLSFCLGRAPAKSERVVLRMGCSAPGTVAGFSQNSIDIVDTSAGSVVLPLGAMTFAGASLGDTKTERELPRHRTQVAQTRYASSIAMSCTSGEDSLSTALIAVLEIELESVDGMDCPRAISQRSRVSGNLTTDIGGVVGTPLVRSGKLEAELPKNPIDLSL